MPRWGMVIDLDRCVACQACTAACRTENNVAFAGPESSELGRAIFWHEVLSEVEGEYPNVRGTFIPRPCMHCDNPPCVRVCPVGATYQNEEGLVLQRYERCIGCRYCMVACPYTAKVFNWYEPEWPDEFKNCLNPDVSIRMKGVVEKCSFCAHRLLKVKETADLEERDIMDEEYLPACAESAIHFGDLENKESKVYKLSRSSRAFREFEDLGTEPKVIYLSKRE